MTTYSPGDKVRILPNPQYEHGLSHGLLGYVGEVVIIKETNDSLAKGNELVVDIGDGLGYYVLASSVEPADESSQTFYAVLDESNELLYACQNKDDFDRLMVLIKYIQSCRALSFETHEVRPYHPESETR